MPNKSPTRLNRALALRGPLISFFHTYGEWSRQFGDSPHFFADIAGCKIEYRTPFQSGRGPAPKLIANAARSSLPFKNYSYSLQVWSEHHSSEDERVTVMTLEWDETTGEVRLTEFLSGAWEYELAEFIAQAHGSRLDSRAAAAS